MIKIKKPLKNWDNIPTSSPYGWRRNPFTGELEFHGGIDKTCNNVKVYPARSGKVTFLLSKNGQFDITTEENGEKIKCCYAHMILDKAIKLGATIQENQLLGKTDSMGKVTGPNLHFGIYDFATRKWENPDNYFGYIEKEEIDVNKYELKEVNNQLIMTNIKTDYAGHCYIRREGKTFTLWIDTKNGKHDRILMSFMDKAMYEVDWAYLKKSYDNRENTIEVKEEYYTVQKGGWVSNVIQEIIKAGIWKGNVMDLVPHFYSLNHPTPKGGYKKGNKVRVK